MNRKGKKKYIQFNIWLLQQLLEEIVTGEYSMRIINQKKIKIQVKSFIAYFNIVKKLKIKNTGFHINRKEKETSKSSSNTYIL